MYSPINEMHPFETSTVSTPSTTTFTPMELHTPNMDYVRRFSYAELLSNHSEASLSDYEQQTPSPSNDYEEYIFHQHPSSLAHPLDEQKRRMSMIEASTCYTSPILPLNYLNPHSIFSSHPSQGNNNNNNNTNHHPMYYSPSPLSHPFQPQQQQQQQQRSMSYSAGDVLSSMVPSNTMFDYNHLSTMEHPMNMNPLDTLSNHHHDLLESMNRDRLNSVSSMPSPIPHHEHGNVMNTNTNTTTTSHTNGQVKVTKNGKVKQCRSRGRRVSSNPTNCAKMFTCKHDDCGKVFKRSEHLKRHIRSIHTLEKPFECPYQSCSKRFSRSDNLNQHIRIHRHTNKDKSNASSNSTSSRQAASFNMPYV
ncbi:unnamed protein product [Cunninghamella blakesleeana]